MNLSYQDYSTYLTRLFSDIENNNCVLLVGAGVSMLPDSWLPSGNEFKNLVVSTLLGRELRSFLHRIENNKIYKNIVPEILFERIHESIGSETFKIFEILRIANSNLGHQTVAFLANTKTIKIYTTNFDVLIDELLQEKRQITHLHGTLDDISGMIIRINQVGRGLAGELRSEFNRTTKNKHLYVLGYSGNDTDIINLINTSNLDAVFWLARPKDSVLVSNLSAISKTVSIAEVDLGRLFMEIKRRYRINLSTLPSPPDHRKIKLQRARIVSKSFTSVPMSKKIAAIQKIAFDIEDYHLAYKAAILAIKKKWFEGVTDAAWFNNAASDAMRILKKYPRALSLARLALRQETDMYTNAASYNLMGLVYLDMNNLSLGVKYFKKALNQLEQYCRLDESLGWHDAVNGISGRINNNLGLAYSRQQRLNEAVSSYKRAIAYKRKFGDPTSMSMTYMNLSIVYFEHQRPNQFRYWRKKAFTYIEKYGLNYQKAYFLRTIGAIKCRSGNVKDGCVLLEESLNYDSVPASLKAVRRDLRRYRSSN